MYKVVKRCFDFICALLALIVLSPIFLLTMIGILPRIPSAPAIISDSRIFLPRTDKVAAAPAHPARIPRGIPISPSTSPSKYLDDLFCVLVAPTLASMPRYLTFSVSDIPKAL